MTHAQVDQAMWQTQMRLERVERELDARRISDRFGKFYAAFATLALALSFFPLYADATPDDDGVTRTFESTWEQTQGNGSGIALLGLLLVMTLVVLLVIAASWVRHVALPAAIAVLSASISTLVLLRPGFGEPEPDLSSAGMACVVLGFVMAALSAGHVLNLGMSRQAS